MKHERNLKEESVLGKSHALTECRTSMLQHSCPDACKGIGRPDSIPSQVAAQTISAALQQLSLFELIACAITGLGFKFMFAGRQRPYCWEAQQAAFIMSQSHYTHLKRWQNIC